MESMTLKQVEEHCLSWMVGNTWKLAREVSERIHDEPGPGKHDFLISALFLKLQRLKDDHVRQGHYYLEYLKFTCEPTCESCEHEGWSAGVPGNWFPVPTLSNTYIPSVVPREEIDSLLPSIQVKRLFATGRRVDSKEVQKLCDDFLIDVNTCNHFIEHQKFLAMKAKKTGNGKEQTSRH